MYRIDFTAFVMRRNLITTRCVRYDLRYPPHQKHHRVSHLCQVVSYCRVSVHLRKKKVALSLEMFDGQRNCYMFVSDLIEFEFSMSQAL